MKTLRRRRLERKTDYKARLTLLKSGEKRLVARKTNRFIIAQIVETFEAQDKVLVGINSKILLAKGWPKEKIGGLKNKAAAYLTGFLLGVLAKKKHIDSLIFDIGVNRNVHKSRLYAVLKGAIDAGIKIPHNLEALPSTSEILNERLKSIMEKIKEN